MKERRGGDESRGEDRKQEKSTGNVEREETLDIKEEEDTSTEVK